MSVDFERSLIDPNDTGLGDLASMPTGELLRLRSELMAEVPIIVAQLQDRNRHPATREDESPGWVEYRAWRRRARWALAHHQQRIIAIKAQLRVRHEAATAARQQRMTGAQDEPADVRALYEERGRRLREELEGQTDLALLLRAYRLVRHLLVDGDELPETLDEADRDALTLVALRLRQAFGVGRVGRFVQGEV